MVEKAIAAQWLPELGLFSSFQREVKFATNSRVDFVLSSSSSTAEESEAGGVVITHEKYVEVKSVSFAHPIDPVVVESAQELLASSEAEVLVAEKGCRFCALFPDTISERAQKHVTELTELIESHSQKAKSKKISAAIIFLVQRDDCHEFAPSFLHDVKFAKLCAEAKLKGIQLLAYAVALEPHEAKQRGYVRLLQALPLYERSVVDKAGIVEITEAKPKAESTKRAKPAEKS